MSDSPDPTRPDPAIATGKVMLIILIAMVLFMSLVVMASTVLTVGPARLPIQLVRFILTIGLFTCVYLGYRWARWVAAVLFGLAALFGGIAFAVIIVTQETNLFGPALIFALTAVYGLCFLALVIPNPITVYLKSKRQVARSTRD